MKIRTFTGAGIKTYLPSISELRKEIFRDYPFLYESTVEHEMAYLNKFTQCSDAIVVVVFDGAKVVGGSTGLPLENEMPEIQNTLIKAERNPADYFCMGESLLLKPYRGRGIGHHFFDLREAHVHHLKRFKKSAFYTVRRPENHPKRPADYVPLDTFWKKRGYVEHPELKAFVSWKDIGDVQNSEKAMTFWIKSL